MTMPAPSRKVPHLRVTARTETRNAVRKPAAADLWHGIRLPGGGDGVANADCAAQIWRRDLGRRKAVASSADKLRSGRWYAMTTDCMLGGRGIRCRPPQPFAPSKAPVASTMHSGPQ